eukprot:6456890-Amphidinium_carterae.1
MTDPHPWAATYMRLKSSTCQRTCHSESSHAYTSTLNNLAWRTMKQNKHQSNFSLLSSMLTVVHIAWSHIVTMRADCLRTPPHEQKTPRTSGPKQLLNALLINQQPGCAKPTTQSSNMRSGHQGATAAFCTETAERGTALHSRHFMASGAANMRHATAASEALCGYYSQSFNPEGTATHDPPNNGCTKPANIKLRW